MTKTKTRKLTLSTETIARLSRDELEGVNGGTGPVCLSLRFCLQASVPVARGLEKVRDHARAHGPLAKPPGRNMPITRAH
jgi:hypothetical protein